MNGYAGYAAYHMLDLKMFYNRIFELLGCFIIEFANTSSDFRREIEYFIIEFSCISYAAYQ